MKVSEFKLPEKLVPYGGIIYFVIILLVSHFVWKFTLLGDESDTLVTFFGMDISAPFIWMSNHVAHASVAVLHFFGSTVSLEPNNVLQHENKNAVRVIWGCSGIKQAYIFFCIIAFYHGPWLKKLWYIPLGLVLVYLFNIFRISAIVAIIEPYPDWFKFTHEYFFKYLFYGMIFGLWVLWEEKISLRKDDEDKDKAKAEAQAKVEAQEGIKK